MYKHDFHHFDNQLLSLRLTLTFSGKVIKTLLILLQSPASLTTSEKQ